MDNVCKICGATFKFNQPRSVCWLCRPNSALGGPHKIVEEYERGFSQLELARKYGVQPLYVMYYIQSYGTPRVRTDRSPNYFSSTVNLDLDWLDGWLLGDGGLSLDLNNQCKNARACFRVKYEEYAQHIVAQWVKMGLECGDMAVAVDEDHILKTTGLPLTSFSNATHAHPLLTRQFNRWYPVGVKRVPVDVRLSPKVVLEWYYGDGTFYKANGCPSLIMGGVEEQEVDYMREKLSILFGAGSISKFKVLDRKRRNSRGELYAPVWCLYFQKKCAAAFFEYVGSSTLQCYQYKWPINYGCAGMDFRNML